VIHAQARRPADGKGNLLTNPCIGCKSGLDVCGISSLAVAVLLMAVSMTGISACGAQESSSVSSASDAALLPDAPSSTRAKAAVPIPLSDRVSPTSSLYVKYVEPDQIALPLSVKDKFVFGFRDAFSPTSMLVWTLAAGYEQARDASPNYGQNGMGFGKRVGAAALRDSSEGVFSDSIFAPIYHQDPRYYKIGNRRGVAYRSLYAITRPLIGLTDGGRATPNFALLSGDFFGSLLTSAYYPQINRGLDQNAKTFGGSLGATALGNLFQEFMGDLVRVGHHRQ
jgi:hypothetical protein